jgi:hypothetical protein
MLDKCPLLCIKAELLGFENEGQTSLRPELMSFKGKLYYRETFRLHIWNLKI